MRKNRPIKEIVIFLSPGKLTTAEIEREQAIVEDIHAIVEALKLSRYKPTLSESGTIVFQRVPARKKVEDFRLTIEGALAECSYPITVGTREVFLKQRARPCI